MIGIAHAFSPSYAQARTRFLEAAAAAGLSIESHAHPLKGRDGEDLAMDVVRDGPADAKKLLEEAFKIRIERTETLRKYARKMEKVLPATKVLRFVQIENKLTALLDWQGAQLIPLVK